MLPLKPIQGPASFNVFPVIAATRGHGFPLSLLPTYLLSLGIFIAGTEAVSRLVKKQLKSKFHVYSTDRS